MYTLTVIIHFLACLALILIVLLQTGKGAEMGAAFGGASQTLFGGGGGTTFLGKLTTAAAVVFMITCLTLTYLSSAPSTKSIMEDVPVQKSEGPLLPDAKPIQPGSEQPVAAQSVPSPQQSTTPAPQPVTQAQEPAAPAPTKEETKAEPAPKAPEKRPEKPAAGTGKKP